MSSIVHQHAEEACFLWARRDRVLRYANLTIDGIATYDGRLEAHIDGLRVAVDAGSSLPDLEPDERGVAFAPIVIALETGDAEQFDDLITRAERNDSCAADAIGALGWVSRSALQGTVKGLLMSAVPVRRAFGIACCAMHGVDPGTVLNAAMTDPNPSLRMRALMSAGQLARMDGLSACQAASSEDGDAGCRFAAARSAIILGDRRRALDTLNGILDENGPDAEAALQTLIAALSSHDAHRLLQRISSSSDASRLLIVGSGVAGEAEYVPWLIEHMKKPKSARHAGESFSLMTGVDLDAQHMWARRPDGFESGPTENPDDENVDMDPDEGLPWPDVKKVEQWWAANASRFQKGQRYFMGEPVTRAHCIDVLKTGYQRQRILAAHYLCLLEPGTPLFNTSAPAWRQQRLLANMS
jgi:uncharacterized protein (TIGR02270 family)